MLETEISLKLCRFPNVSRVVKIKIKIIHKNIHTKDLKEIFLKHVYFFGMEHPFLPWKGIEASPLAVLGNSIVSVY
jgi:hypothetical protein